MEPFVDVLVFVGGLTLVLATLNSAIKTFVLPRSARTWLSAVVFIIIRRLFSPWTHAARTFAARDEAMAMYAPLSLLLLPVTWLAVVAVGYTGMFWALDVRPLGAAFKVSGSSLLTLGFAPVDTLATTMLAFTEATLGLGLVALLIAYLPTMYSAFSRREKAVSMLEVRAGAPPRAVEMIARFQRIRGLEALTEEWVAWEDWFTELEETHTSLSALVFFRSPVPGRSWVTAAGTVLDAAALTAAVVDVPRDPRAELCIRAGYLALRRIGDFFRIEYDSDPRPGDAISITRTEFDIACNELAEGGVPLKPDREQAWRDYCGWRVNYDTVLLSLAALIMAPYAPWTSDRSVRGMRPDGQ